MSNVVPLTVRKKIGLELWRQREKMISREHPLRQLFWECTLRCNLHCRHCGSDCKVTAGQADMPKEDFLRVLDGIAQRTNPHDVFVIVSGGEPLMRDDLEACGAAIYAKGFPWGMVSNGLALTPERYQGLLKAHIHAITLSIDGLEQEHNWMRGHPKSFERVDQAISLIVSTPKVSFDVVTCVNRRNYGQLDQLKEYLIGKGVKYWRLFTVFPVGRAAQDSDMRLTNDEFRGVFEFIKRTRQEGRIHADYGCEGFLGNYEGDVRDHLFSCQAGITIGSVLIDGSISACTSIRSDYHQGNIYKDDFMDVWEQRFQPYRNHEWMKTGDCAECSYFRYCQGNGMHLRDGDGRLLLCHVKRLKAYPSPPKGEGC
jgi:radical SAM enzyme (rSAM/lipoprotein system)